MIEVNQLKDGDCTVVAKFSNKIKRFKGKYNGKFGIVFFLIPDYYEIIGYEQ